MSLQVELLETSFEKVKPNAGEFAASFYNNLFTAYPEAKPLFAHTDLKEQQKKLIASLVMVVENLRNPEALEGPLKGLGARHVKYGALPEHYPLVGNALLTTFEQYLGDSWTEDVKQAWVDAYGAITNIMLDGADYEQSEVELESATTANIDATTSEPNVNKSEAANLEINAPEGKINWGIFGGIFAGAGLLTILLLIL